MQRFVNNPDLVVEDTVKGFIKAHSDIVRLAENPRVVVAKNAPVKGKVGVITGGGSGHEPGFMELDQELTELLHHPCDTTVLKIT